MNRLIYHLLSSRFGARLEIQILMRQTAKAFREDGCASKSPLFRKHSRDCCLNTYARFTADTARRAINNGQDMKHLHHRLYHMARHLGTQLRRRLKPENDQECQDIIALLYRNIGINIKESSPGEFTVQKCYFSTFYTPDICAVISAIDQGIFAGIYGRGKLTFQERITEGRYACKAFLFSK
ncbi:MAG: hypothetical protein LUD18_00090 [Lachnospiraceae bacterium]|nr:hypothetical protein [Lachnospiraceae bacterium]